MRTYIQHHERELPLVTSPYGYPSLDSTSPAIACDHSTHIEEQSNHFSLAKPEPLLPMLFTIINNQLTTLVSLQVYTLCALFIMHNKCASISNHHALVKKNKKIKKIKSKCTNKTEHFKTSDISNYLNIKNLNKDRCLPHSVPGSFSLIRK